MLDLSGQELRKLPKNENNHIFKVLDVSKNCLQKLENIEHFNNITEVIKYMHYTYLYNFIIKLTKMFKVNCKSQSNDENVHSSKINKISETRFI